MQTAKQLKTYVVQNPVSGLSDAPTIRDKISQVMDENQIPFEIYETTGKEDLYEVVKAATGRGFERFVAVGGDGTISGVASGLINTKIPLVIIPTGTVNALARELQIPFTLDEAVRWWVEESARSKFIDVIEARERYYLLNVSAGAAAKIMKEARREDIHRFGAVVYLWNALKRFFDVPTIRFRLLVDGKPVCFRASQVMKGGAATATARIRITMDAMIVRISRKRLPFLRYGETSLSHDDQDRELCSMCSTVKAQRSCLDS